MTVTNIYEPVREQGNGLAVAFDFSFEVLAETDLVVSKVVRATGVETALTLNVDYTVALNAVTAGGTVTYTTAPLSTEDSFIRRAVTQTQAADIPINNVLREPQIENALDRNLMIIQDQQVEIDRALRKRETDEDLDTLLPAAVASRVIGFNSGGDGLTSYDIDQVYSATFDSISNYSNDLATAVSAIGSAKRSLVIDSEITVSGNVTVPTTINLMFLREGMITVSAGVTLTINGPLYGGLWQLFDGTGTVTIGGKHNSTVYPQWWGAVADGSNDDTDAINSALTAAGEGQTSTVTPSHLHFPAGNYKITSTITIDGTRGLTITGDDNYRSYILNSQTDGSAAMEIGLTTACYMINMKDLCFRGNEAYTDGNGLSVKSTYWSRFENLFFQFTGRHGVQVDSAYQNIWDQIRVRRAGYGQAGHFAGIKCIGNVSGTFRNFIIDECDDGIFLETAGAVFENCDINAIDENCVYMTGVCNVTFINTYFESNAPTMVGDGTDWVTFAKFINCKFGGNDRVYIEKTRHYEFEGCHFTYPEKSITVVDPTVSKGYIGRNTYVTIDNTVPPKVILEHGPGAINTGNLIRNGSFEYNSSASAFQGWTASLQGVCSGGVEVSTDESLHDEGLVSCKFDCTAYTSGEGLKLACNTIQPLKDGLIYTLAFSYKTASTAFKFHVDQSGTNFANPYTLAASSTWKRVSFKFRSAGAASPTIYFLLAELETAYLDCVSLRATVDEIEYSDEIKHVGEVETYHIQDALALSATHINAAVQAYSADTSFAAQPDIPRNVTTTGSAGAAAGTLTVKGINWKGQYVTEDITVTGGAVTDAGAVAFARILELDGYDAGAGQTLSVGIGDLVGLPKQAMDSISTAVIKVKKNNADMTVPTYNHTNNTLDLSTITGADDYTIWYLR